MASFLQSLGQLANDVGTKYKLPELGISERLGYNPRSFAPAASSKVLGASTSAPATNQSSLNYSPFTPTTSYSPAPFAGGGGGTQAPAAPSNNLTDIVNQNAGDLQSQADFEFEQALGLISQQEGVLRGQGETDIQGQTIAGEQARTRASQAKEAQLGGLAQEGQVAEKTASSGLKQARDLFRQIQQQNVAQLSGLGISSSSVTEALAERLGVETAQRIAGVTGSLDEVRQNIAKEKTRVEEVFQTKLTEIQDNTQLAIQRIQAGVQQGLAQLAAARGQAANAKSQARTDITINARNQIFQIQQEAQQRAQAVQEAAARRSQALAEAEQFMFRPTDFQGLQSHVQNVSTLPQVGGFQAVPTFTPQTVQGQGFLNPGVSYEKKPQEDQLLNPFGQ